MDEPVKNSIWNYLIPLYYLEQVSSTFGRRVVELNLTSHIYKRIEIKNKIVLDEHRPSCYYI